jgi:hypothetical protein
MTGSADEREPAFTRGETLSVVVGVVALAVGGLVLRAPGWDYVRWTEDFLPGTAPTDVLQPDALESPGMGAADSAPLGTRSRDGEETVASQASLQPIGTNRVRLGSDPGPSRSDWRHECGVPSGTCG